ncbi:perlucin-like protein [Patiria miniata]|uniref:C-type lectin domain-containing protein n=1 Tax=Patiria miniata TaxID=46514 RepID=A0A914ASY6_PATMI|nr:perlucin-like protein [Patiria miniata]
MSPLVLFVVILQLVLITLAHDQGENTCLPSEKCPLSWKQWRDSCYRFTPTVHSWFAAREACLQLGGNLAAPRSQEENDFFWEFGKEEITSTVQKFWINCDDLKTNGQWFCEGESVDDPGAFLNWAANEPNHLPSEQCAAVVIDQQGR